MLRIGLTGGIAAGKSAVSRQLGDLGAVVVDADLLARQAVEPGSPGLDEVVAAFGPEVLGADGSLDRPALGRLIFADGSARERLNAIIHPRVRAEAARRIDEAPDAAVVVEDIPLLVETGQASRFHLVVVVDAPDEVRIERMIGQRGMKRGDAERRIAAQAPRPDRLREADAVLLNDRGLEDLHATTAALWEGRIVPFRDNLAAGRAAARRLEPAPAGLAGTSGLGRRLQAKLTAALPAGAVVGLDGGTGEAPGTASRGTSGYDDVVSAVVRVGVPGSVEVDTASALAAAGFPQAGSSREQSGAGVRAVHRAADPALDVTVLVRTPPDPG